MSEQVIKCEQCGSDDATIYFPGSGCSKCESPRPKVGELSNYCKTGIMHFHCQSEFDWDCGCSCHEYFDVEYGIIKPMTEEYFFKMVENGKFSWIQLTKILELIPGTNVYKLK
jgi:hypothetical protein